MLNPKTEKKIRTIIVDELGCDEAEVTPNANIMIDLGADSLDAIDLAMSFEEAFEIDIPDEDVDKLERVKDVYSYVEKKIEAKQHTAV